MLKFIFIYFIFLIRTMMNWISSSVSATEMMCGSLYQLRLLIGSHKPNLTQRKQKMQKKTQLKTPKTNKYTQRTPKMLAFGNKKKSRSQISKQAGAIFPKDLRNFENRDLKASRILSSLLLSACWLHSHFADNLSPVGETHGNQ